MKVDKKLGHYLFLAGVVIAILAGIVTDVMETSIVVTVLLILGVIVGFLNITHKETGTFLIASIVLMVAGVAPVSMIPGIGVYLQAILLNIVTFVAPAALVVALKVIYKLAEKR